MLVRKIIFPIRKLLGSLSQSMDPAHGFCFHCGITWSYTENHVTDYEWALIEWPPGSGNWEKTRLCGCFPLCEFCWKNLTVEERLPHYQKLVLNTWGENAGEWQKVRKAVMEGG